MQGNKIVRAIVQAEIKKMPQPTVLSVTTVASMIQAAVSGLEAKLSSLVSGTVPAGTGAATASPTPTSTTK